MFLDGFFVSPAVTPRLSVPPSAVYLSDAPGMKGKKRHTSKAGSDEHACKPAESTAKWSSFDSPVATADVFVVRVDTDVYENAQDNENQDRRHFERGEPVFCSI